MSILFNKKIILLFYIFLVSCKLHEIELKNINLKEVKSIENNNIIADVELKINNKNNFSVFLKKIKIIIENDDKKMCSINLIKPIKVLPDEKIYSAQLKIEIEKEFKNLKNILANIFAAKKGLSYKGEIILNKFLLRKKIKIDKTNK